MNVAQRRPGTRPGLRRLYRQSFHSRGLGAWLYRRETLKWLMEPELRTQLPLPFKVFAHFACLQFRLPVGVIVGGRWAFSWARRAHRVWSSDAIRLEVAGKILYLNADDPRLLTVPSELMQLLGKESVLQGLLSAGDSFIDVGANHGAFSVAAACAVGRSGRIVCVEPQPALASLIERTLRANEFDHFHVFSCACSDVEGEGELFVPRSSSGAGGLHRGFSTRGDYHTFKVRLRLIDQIMAGLHLPGAVVMKLDVEGHELSVLRGATAFIRARKPRIIMEINPSAMAAAGNQVEDLQEVLSQLRCAGYRPVRQSGQLHSVDSLTDNRERDVILEFK